MKSLPAIYLISFAFQRELEKRLRMNRRELGEQYAEMQSFQDIRYLSACSLSQVLLMRRHPCIPLAPSRRVRPDAGSPASTDVSLATLHTNTPVATTSH